MRIEKLGVLSSKGTLAAVIHYPEEEAGRLAILCPGYLDSKDYRGMVGLAESLSEHGYAAVRFDPTGTWESDGDISDYNITQCLKDIRSILDHMLRQASYRQVLLGGHSRGGQVALLYAARDPRVTIVAGIMPSSGRTIMDQRHEEWMKNGFSISQRDLPGDKDRTKEFRVPLSHLLDHNRYDVLKDVKRLKIPVVLVAGELDTTCPLGVVREIYDAANQPKTLVVMPGIGHDYRHNDAEVKLVDEKLLGEVDALRKMQRQHDDTSRF